MIEELSPTRRTVHNGAVHSPDLDTSLPPDGSAATGETTAVWIDWLRPLVESRTWLALAFVAASGITCFVWASVIGLAGFFVAPFLALRPHSRLVDSFFGLSRGLSLIDAAMALWAGHRIDVRDATRATEVRHGLDGVERWRFVGYHMANTLIAPVLAAVALAPGIIIIVAIAVGLGWIGMPLYVVLLLAWPPIVLGAAQTRARWLDWSVGPDRLAAAERRVSVLSEQRADILDAVAGERRRIERNLHDGVQQQLVAIGLDLGRADTKFDDDPAAARRLVNDARVKVQDSIGELRRLARGLHPAILEDRGLDAALSAIVAGSSLPITLGVDDDLDLGTDVMSTAYLVINEAIANVLKHADARTASIEVRRVSANVRITIHDDGKGGAEILPGHGLAGIRARIEGVDGVLTLGSPPGGPTTLVIEMPRHDRDAPT